MRSKKEVRGQPTASLAARCSGSLLGGIADLRILLGETSSGSLVFGCTEACGQCPAWPSGVRGPGGGAGLIQAGSF